ncbi:MAG: nucleotidyltransferase domain-containing protein, partial [Magnetococcales bacterium]|nr:nucleotidyltransferase domain-containing protein [Magnetococcales bacterium]
MISGIEPTLDLATRHREMLDRLLERYLPETTVWAHGSRVQGRARPYSDLDLVVFCPLKERARVIELKEALDESDLPILVDLLIWDELTEAMRRGIVSCHVVMRAGNGGKPAGDAGSEG